MENSVKIFWGDKESRRTYPKVTSLPCLFQSFILQVSCQLQNVLAIPTRGRNYAQNRRFGCEKFLSWHNSGCAVCSRLKHVTYKSGA
ncbi:MAG: hypothetical protein ALAOOOJD_03301 [bacterium]|nr:hypothetical protein [bacterium]